VTLLGQNVNSYLDESNIQSFTHPAQETSNLSRGFKTIYKPRTEGRRFADLLDFVSRVNPNMRIRFTSPHPKDFPDDLLHLMRDRPNICKQIHLPAQSGSTTVLERMRRGYTREAYIQLVHHIREIIPEVAFSSDFISGFCGETEQDHQDTLKLIEEVGYDMAYMFAYSMREKTMAHRRYVDDVPVEVKKRRLAEMIALFYSLLNQRAEKTIGRRELLLVEGLSKKSEQELCGRADDNRMIVFPKSCVLDETLGQARTPQVGDYVEVKIVRAQGSTPIAEPIRFSSITNFVVS
jgi:MiaB/RimO family radical SAM methylthiotransferase